MEKSSSSPITPYMETAIHIKATQLIGSYGYTHADQADIVQELTLDLLTRLPRFDPTRASRDTFAARIIDRCVSTLIRHRKQHCRDYRREAGSLDEPLDDDMGAGTTRRDLLSTAECDYFAGRLREPEADRLDLVIDVSMAIRALPPGPADLAVRLADKPITEVARELNVPRSTLYDAGIARIRCLFEDRGLKEYL